MREHIQLNRRQFVGSLGALPLVGFSATESPRPLKFASIGCGGMGGAATESLLATGGELVAICDVNPKAFSRWESRFPGIPKFMDYREMLRKMGPQIDAVQIGTPDHTHAYLAIECMKARKHVYVQKPLARTVEECEMLKCVQQETGCVAQMGNQGHPGVWRYRALREAGIWGDVKEFISWSDRPIWPQGMKEYALAQPLPQEFEKGAWDCWCGPSPDHGFSSAYHPFKWRGWWDYGCGAIGDMAVHNADPAFWAFELGLPTSVMADTYGGGPVTIAYPKVSRIEMTFAPSRWINHPVKLTWYDGKIFPSQKLPISLDYMRLSAQEEEKRREVRLRKAGKDYVANPNLEPHKMTNGLIVVGSKRTTIGGSHASVPKCVVGDFKDFDAALKRGNKLAHYNHYREFVEACWAHDPAKCGSKFSYAAPLTEALLLGCIALRYPGEKLSFDAKEMRFTNKSEANQFLKAPSRGAWDFQKLLHA